MINREIDRRTPTIETTEGDAKADAAKRPHASREWEFHQDGRDMAATIGCAVVAFMLLLVFVCSAVAIFRVWTSCSEADAPAEVMDGSTAGANAVTKEDLERECGAPRVTPRE